MAICVWNANLCQARCTVFYTYYLTLACQLKLHFMVEQQGSERPRCLLKVKAKMSAEGQAASVALGFKPRSVSL